MNILITGKQIDIGDALKEHIETSIHKMVEKYFGDIIEAHVYISRANISKDHFQFHTELSFEIFAHFTIQAKMEDYDAYRSFNLAMDRLESRIQRYRSRLRQGNRHLASLEKETIPAVSQVIQGTSLETEGESPVIIAEMDITIPTVTVSDAVMHMDLTDQPLLMFRNAGSGHLNVVYKRSDGNIGWINPSILPT
jgi:ribosomal subunit interface protein